MGQHGGRPGGGQHSGRPVVGQTCGMPVGDQPSGRPVVAQSSESPEVGQSAPGCGKFTVRLDYNKNAEKTSKVNNGVEEVAELRIGYAMFLKYT